jgi:hypothetical protein
MAHLDYAVCMPLGKMIALTALLVSSLSAPLAAQGEGDRAAEIEAGTWFGWIGEEPRLESFEGRAVLLHFFVCKEPKKSNWLGMMRAQREFGAKGLQILAITPDSAGAVQTLLDEFPLPFPVGAGSGMNANWGMGEYGQVLIDAKGDVFYRAGASNAVWDGKIIKVIRNTKRLAERAHLRLTPMSEQPKKLNKAVDLLSEGQLAKADVALEKIIASTSGKEEDRQAAVSLREALKDHVSSVLGKIEAERSRGEVLLAMRALTALAKDLKKLPLGAEAVALLSKLSEDELHLEEVEAAETLAHIVDAFFRRGWEKNKERWERLIEAHPTTHAAGVIQRFWLPRPW